MAITELEVERPAKLAGEPVMISGCTLCVRMQSRS